MVEHFQLQYESDDHAKYYAEKHDSTARRRISNFFERAMIERSLRRIWRVGRFETALDLPSGTGRFLPVLARFNARLTAMDSALPMLRESRRWDELLGSTPGRVTASVFEIPLRDHSVDVVLCARLLHHFADEASRAKLFRELARVARVGVVVSFFDATSYYAWKRRRKIERTGRESGRHSITRDECCRLAEAAGLRPLGMNAILRFHSEITAAAFAVA